MSWKRGDVLGTHLANPLKFSGEAILVLEQMVFLYEAQALQSEYLVLVRCVLDPDTCTIILDMFWI